NDAAGKRIGRDEGGETRAVHADQAHAGGEEEIVIGAFADGKDFRLRHAVTRRKAAPVAGEEHQPAFVKPYPDTAGVVLKDRVGFVRRQALGLAIDRERVVAKPGEPVVGAHPEIALAIFQKAADQVAVAAAFGGSHKTVALKTRQPAVGADPDVAVAVFDDGANVQVRQPVVSVEFANGAVRRAEHQAKAPSHPEVV